MAPARKTVKQYELEAAVIGKCLIHPAYGVARKLYMLRHGNLPSHIAVCHTCDNSKCIKDKHHFPGTWGDNVRDAVSKGRHSCFRKGGIRFSGTHTSVAKKKISEASKRRWRNKEYRDLIAKKMLAWRASLTAAQRSEIANKTWRTRRDKNS